jgi:hypothetical protein
MSKGEEVTNKIVYHYQEIKISYDPNEVNDYTSDKMSTIPEIIAEDAQITYFETDIIVDIVNKGWFAPLWNMLGYNTRGAETAVNYNQTTFNDKVPSNSSSESSNLKTSDVENPVVYENSPLEAKAEPNAHKGYFARFLEILTFGSNRAVANKKLVELTEVILPDEKQAKIKQILSESLSLNSTPEEIMLMLDQIINSSKVTGDGSALTTEE